MWKMDNNDGGRKRKHDKMDYDENTMSPDSQTEDFLRVDTQSENLLRTTTDIQLVDYVRPDADIQSEGLVDADSQLEDSVRTDADSQLEDSVRTDADTQSEGSVRTDADTQSEGSVRIDADTQSEVSVRTDADTQSEGSVRTVTPSEDMGSTFNPGGLGFTEEYDSVSAHILSLAAAVSSPSGTAEETRTAEETKTISSVESHDSTILLQTVKSSFPVTNLVESGDDFEVLSPRNCSLSDYEVEETILETTSNSNSHKAVAKKSTGSKPKRPLKSREYPNTKIEDNIKQSFIQGSSQLKTNCSNNANVQEVSNDIFLENGCKQMNTQSQEEYLDEICDAASICKIVSVTSVDQNNKNIASIKSLPCKSKDLKFKNDEISSLKPDIPINEEHGMNFEDIGIRMGHVKSFIFLPKWDQENKCISSSELDETSQPTVESFKETDEINVVDIDELLMEEITENSRTEENIDVEVVDIEKDEESIKTKKVISEVYKDINNIQDMNDDESFKNSSGFSPHKTVQSTNNLSDKTNKSYSLCGSLPKSNSCSSNKPIHHSNEKLLKTHTKAKIPTDLLPSESLLEIVDTADSSIMPEEAPITSSTFAKDSSIEHSNLAPVENPDLNEKQKQIIDRVSQVKNLCLSNLLDHLTEDDIITLGGEIYKDNQPLGFDRGLEPETILGMFIDEGRDFFILKWVGSNVTDMVTAEEAKIRCPQIVIAFYERHYKLTL